jgi:tetratricopeptide (TPR) repeat protein
MRMLVELSKYLLLYIVAVTVFMCTAGCGTSTSLNPTAMVSSTPTPTIQIQGTVVKDTDTYFRWAIDYYRHRDLEHAILNFNKAIELNPDYADAYMNRGAAYAESADYGQAIRDYNKAIELNPDIEYAYYGRGLAYYYSGNPEQAILDYNRAIELDPNYAYAYLGRGLAYHQAGNAEQAVLDFEQYLKLAPPDASNRATVAKAIRRIKFASNSVTRYIIFIPFIILFLAETFWILRARPAARRLILQQLLPAHIGIPIAVFGLLTKQRPLIFSALVISIGIVLAQFLLHLPPYYRRAHKRFQGGDLNNALDLINKSIQARPNSSEAYYLRSLIYLALKLPGKAEQDARKAIQIKPHSPAGFRALGQIFYLRGCYSQAKEAFTEALTLNPGNPLLLSDLGQTCYRLGQYEEAIENLKLAAISRLDDACNLSIHYFLGRSLEELGKEGQADDVFETMRRFRRGLSRLEEQYSSWPDDLPEMQLAQEDLEDMRDLLE